MTLDPIFGAPLEIQVHIYSAIPAIVLGPIAIYRKKRDFIHKCVGYSWVASMLVLALSSFFIRGWALVGPFGPIHLLSVFVLYGLFEGVRDARARRIDAHKAGMQDLYWWAIGIAGLLTLLPGRRMSSMLFGESETLGFWVIGCGFVGLAARWWLSRPGRLLHV